MIAIRPATLDDVQGIAQLLDRYYIGNLTDTQKARGFISVQFAAAAIQSMVLGSGMVVAVTEDNTVIAVTGCSPVPSHGGSDIFKKVDDLINRVAFKGKPLSAHRLCMYGPVCVDEAYSGQGLSSRLFQGFIDMVRGQCDVGLAFVSLSNPTSLKVHRDKLGMAEVCDFEVEGQGYALLAFDVSCN